jgi:hypothetical protein
MKNFKTRFASKTHRRTTRSSAQPKRSRTASRGIASRRLLISTSAPIFTPWQRKETLRRRGVLEAFKSLQAGGLNQQQAAEELGESVVTLWRWRQRVEPLTHKCGRQSIANKFKIPLAVLRQICALQIGGKGNEAAWRSIVDDPQCPPDLAAYLRNAKNICASLLALTEVKKRTAEVYETPEVFALTKSTVRK